MLRGAGDLVSVAVDSRRKPVPVDAFPVAARRVVHDEPAGDHERVVACLARLARERSINKGMFVLQLAMVLPRRKHKTSIHLFSMRFIVIV